MNKAISALRHLFIPHKHNDYKPHFFREISILSISVTAIILLTISVSSTLYIRLTDMKATVLPSVLVDLTNDVRKSNNELTLSRSPVLDAAAKLKAEDMSRLGYFAHTSPEGLNPWHWFDKAGYYFSYAGENLAINFNESIDVENAWLESPTHKANILNNNFTEIGIATVSGIYQGVPTTYVVQMFGTPATFIPNNKTENAPKVSAPSPRPIAQNKPVVKGEFIAEDKSLETITNTKEFISVKNTEAAEKLPMVQNSPSPRYSSWNQKLLFLVPSYTDRIYRIIMWIVLLALLIMVITEIRIQHPKNIMYGIFLLGVIVCLIYVNKSMFLTNLI